VAQEYARIAFAPVDAELDHGKALQATRLKLQALAALTRHLDLFTEKPEPGLTPEDRERYEARLAAHERNWQHSLESMRKLERERDEARIALDEAKRKAATGLENPNPSIFPVKRERPKPSPPPETAEMAPQGIPPRDSPEFHDLLGKLRRGTLEFTMAQRMINAGYGPEPEPDMTYQMEVEYEPNWG